MLGLQRRHELFHVRTLLRSRMYRSYVCNVEICQRQAGLSLDQVGELYMCHNSRSFELVQVFDVVGVRRYRDGRSMCHTIMAGRC